MASNPFTPTFGSSPPLLVGRQDLIDDFGDGLDNGPGSPERAVLFAGVRGIGKTVMLNAVEDAARERSLWSSNQGMRSTRWGTPEEIANLIVFAVSDAASYINGAELVADNAMDKS